MDTLSRVGVDARFTKLGEPPSWMREGAGRPPRPLARPPAASRGLPAHSWCPSRPRAVWTRLETENHEFFAAYHSQLLAKVRAAAPRGCIAIRQKWPGTDGLGKRCRWPPLPLPHGPRAAPLLARRPRWRGCPCDGQASFA